MVTSSRPPVVADGFPDSDLVIHPRRVSRDFSLFPGSHPVARASTRVLVTRREKRVPLRCQLSRSVGATRTLLHRRHAPVSRAADSTRTSYKTPRSYTSPLVYSICNPLCEPTPSRAPSCVYPRYHPLPLSPRALVLSRRVAVVPSPPWYRQRAEKKRQEPDIRTRSATVARIQRKSLRGMCVARDFAERKTRAFSRGSAILAAWGGINAPFRAP